MFSSNNLQTSKSATSDGTRRLSKSCKEEDCFDNKKNLRNRLSTTFSKKVLNYTSTDTQDSKPRLGLNKKVSQVFTKRPRADKFKMDDSALSGEAAHNLSSEPDMPPEIRARFDALIAEAGDHNIERNELPVVAHHERPRRTTRPVMNPFTQNSYGLDDHVINARIRRVDNHTPLSASGGLAGNDISSSARRADALPMHRYNSHIMATGGNASDQSFRHSDTSRFEQSHHFDHDFFYDQPASLTSFEQYGPHSQSHEQRRAETTSTQQARANAGQEPYLNVDDGTSSSTNPQSVYPSFQMDYCNHDVDDNVVDGINQRETTVTSYVLGYSGNAEQAADQDQPSPSTQNLQRPPPQFGLQSYEGVFIKDQVHDPWQSPFRQDPYAAFRSTDRIYNRPNPFFWQPGEIQPPFGMDPDDRPSRPGRGGPTRMIPRTSYTPDQDEVVASDNGRTGPEFRLPSHRAPDSFVARPSTVTNTGNGFVPPSSGDSSNSAETGRISGTPSPSTNREARHLQPHPESNSNSLSGQHTLRNQHEFRNAVQVSEFARINEFNDQQTVASLANVRNLPAYLSQRRLMEVRAQALNRVMTEAAANGHVFDPAADPDDWCIPFEVDESIRRHLRDETTYDEILTRMPPLNTMAGKHAMAAALSNAMYDLRQAEAALVAANSAVDSLEDRQRTLTSQAASHELQQSREIARLQNVLARSHSEIERVRTQGPDPNQNLKQLTDANEELSKNLSSAQKRHEELELQRQKAMKATLAAVDKEHDASQRCQSAMSVAAKAEHALRLEKSRVSVLERRISEIRDIYEKQLKFAREDIADLGQRYDCEHNSAHSHVAESAAISKHEDRNTAPSDISLQPLSIPQTSYQTGSTAVATNCVTPKSTYTSRGQTTMQSPQQSIVPCMLVTKEYPLAHASLPDDYEYAGADVFDAHHVPPREGRAIPAVEQSGKKSATSLSSFKGSSEAAAATRGQEPATMTKSSTMNAIGSSSNGKPNTKIKGHSHRPSLDNVLEKFKTAVGLSPKKPPFAFPSAPIYKHSSAQDTEKELPDTPSASKNTRRNTTPRGTASKAKAVLGSPIADPANYTASKKAQAMLGSPDPTAPSDSTLQARANTAACMAEIVSNGHQPYNTQAESPQRKKMRESLDQYFSTNDTLHLRTPAARSVQEAYARTIGQSNASNNELTATIEVATPEISTYSSNGSVRPDNSRRHWRSFSSPALGSLPEAVFENYI